MVVFVCHTADYYEKVENITLPKKGRELHILPPPPPNHPQMLTILKRCFKNRVSPL